jgi:hypothetical protein
MFKKIANKIKSVLFKAQKIDASSPVAKAQAKLIDQFADQADAVADIAVEAAENIVKDAKKEVAKAVKDATKATKKPAAKKPTQSTGAKKGRPKKTTK